MIQPDDFTCLLEIDELFRELKSSGVIEEYHIIIGSGIEDTKVRFTIAEGSPNKSAHTSNPTVH